MDEIVASDINRMPQESSEDFLGPEYHLGSDSKTDYWYVSKRRSSEIGVWNNITHPVPMYFKVIQFSGFLCTSLNKSLPKKRE